ncbi:MAG: YceI family protein [Balneolaceae bacterium]|nr:MAG: YceI family protein [Balneolaceae bacterium]
MAYAMHKYLRIIFAAVLAALLTPAMTMAQIYFDTHEDSRIWLEGSSTVHRFDCVARSIQGTAFIEGFGEEIQPTVDTREERDGSGSTGPDMDAGDHETGGLIGASGLPSGEIHLASKEITGEDFRSIHQSLHVLLKIPVESFDCRHSRMNRDMYEALKSEKYDYITFEFEDARRLENDGSVPESLFDEGYQPFRIHGVLNVAGVDRDVSLLVQGRTDGDARYHIKGQKEISMKDFDIDPPTALRGLIRAHDDLTVFFDLHVMESTRD